MHINIYQLLIALTNIDNEKTPSNALKTNMYKIMFNQIVFYLITFLNSTIFIEEKQFNDTY